ncbi:hypothetical protein JRQ81_001487 [Phrynocephalus forsythii]|uniref:HMG box domain-containing protein n=1 Tax=Phrynocephalus forsythii TaxID=171643 RepID=A0A9Q0Y8H0_9SAUR|nr:hypothetical protein JRQ81_001487 [Phrynocephalus forsythii]
MPPSALDVNITPDKSQVLLHNKESICHAMEDVLTSLYGPLCQATSCGSDKMDATVGELSCSETEQTGAPVSETKSKQHRDPHIRAPLFSFHSDVQNSEIEEATDVCLKNQALCDNSSQAFPSQTHIAGNEIGGSNSFQDDSLSMLLCEDQQENSMVKGNLGNNTLIGISSKNSTEDDLGNGLFQETEKGDGAVILKDSSEVTADKWSLGNAFKNSRGENLNPVRILIPQTEGARPQTKNSRDEQQEFQQKEDMKKTNVVSDKVGRIKAYDMISSQIIRKPMSAFALFAQDHRPELLTKNAKVSAEELMPKMEEMWKALEEQERKKYEEKAARDLERYNRQSRKAKNECMQRSTKEKEKRPKATLKDCLSNQLKLDALFHSPVEKKNTCQAIKIVQVPFSMDSLKHKLHVLEQNISDKDEHCLIHLLNFPDTWIIASQTKIIMLNPYRIEEALLFKRLLEHHKLPIEKLEKPVVLTDSLLGGSRYMDVLCNMSEKSVQFEGSSYLLDSRLISNGFKIKIIPVGPSVVESQVEIEGMANCLPYYGVADLKEILSAVVNNNAKEVHECRPLKVGEAVRLSRQLPLYLSKEDVQDTVCRMKKQLGFQHKTCVHGRPLIHYLTEIPQNN